VPSPTEPGHRPPAAPSPAPPRGKSCHDPEHPAAFGVIARRPQLWQPGTAAISDLHSDSGGAGCHRYRDRLPGKTRAAMPDAVAESLASRTASSPQGCPGPSTAPTNARTTRARSPRPATLTLSRSFVPAISAPAFPSARNPTRASGRTEMNAHLSRRRQAELVARKPCRAGEAISFGLDGTRYEIDLNGEHARELRGELERNAKAARKATGSSGRPARARRSSADDKNKEVRDWARERAWRSTTAAASLPISSPSTRRRTASRSRLPPVPGSPPSADFLHQSRCRQENPSESQGPVANYRSTTSRILGRHRRPRCSWQRVPRREIRR
jgi:hypothetical protein